MYSRLLALSVAVVLFLGLSRLFISGLYADRLDGAGDWTFIVLQGLRFDGILLGLLLGPLLILKPLLHLGDQAARWGKRLLPTWAALATVFIVMVEGSTRAFIAEYGSRPNYLYVEYLRYPREVLSMLSGTHLLELIVLWCLAGILAFLVFRWLRRDPAWSLRLRPVTCAWLVPLALLVTVALVRSTLDHRPVNPSNAMFTDDSLVNQLPLNSPYSLLYAVYEHQRHDLDAPSPYGALEPDTIQRIVLREAGLPKGRAAVDRPIPTLHCQRATHRHKPPLNLVIILLESVGANHVGELGGKPLTPSLDALANEGLWLDRLYATGVRSARGIEAVIAGFTPTHLDPVVKLPNTQTGFFTLAQLLDQAGYSTQFIYGGESHFDNMRRFFLNNGFDEVIDENDYDDPVYMGGWGVSDEDLFTRAHDRFLAQGDEPFFSLVFTSSNHEPFDIPPDRVTLETGPDGPRETAIKYADFALGQFLDRARAAPYWDRTVFLVVADHSAHKWGGALVPVDRFRIPGVFIGDGIPARRVPGITSQIDLLPTALSLIGLDSRHPGIGRDLTLPEYRDGAGRAMMQFHQNQAYIQDDWIIVLQPDWKPRSFRLDEQGEWIWDNSAPSRLKNTALAHALWGPLVIRNNAYRLP